MQRRTRVEYTSSALRRDAEEQPRIAFGRYSYAVNHSTIGRDQTMWIAGCKLFKYEHGLLGYAAKGPRCSIRVDDLYLVGKPELRQRSRSRGETRREGQDN